MDITINIKQDNNNLEMCISDEYNYSEDYLLYNKEDILNTLEDYLNKIGVD